MPAPKLAALLTSTALLAAIAGLAVGIRFKDPLVAAFTGHPIAAASTPASAATTAQPATLYTCAMHPQIRLDKPGLCPICHMELTPLHLSSHADNPSTVTIDPVMIQNMGLRLASAEQGELPQTVRAVGTLTEPEQNHIDINLRVSGWVQKLFANQEGMLVSKGDPLFELYSPDITAAADELIAARKAAGDIAQSPNPEPLLAKSSALVLAAGKRKLELLGLTTEQVEAIAKMDKAPDTVTITAPRNGHLAEKKVIEGAAITAGQQLFEIADRSSMWLQAQVYEQQLGLVAVGQKAKVTVSAVPGQLYEGTVDFVYPHLDAATRTATVRITLNNHDHRLHENMYATVELQSPPTAASVLVPREAVIDSGLRQIVFVAEGDGRFSPRQVALGRSGRRNAKGGELVQILSGLTPGEQIVTSGQFLLDSESRMQEATQKFLAANAPAATMPAPTVHNGPANPRVTSLLQAYLPLAAFFGAPQTSATPAIISGLETAAGALKEDPDPALRSAALEIEALITPMRDQSIEQQRDAFKPLSQKIVALAQSQPLAPGFGTLYVFECPMDNARWLQQTPTPANPFFPIVMKTCGTQKLSLTPTGASPTTAPATQPAEGSMQ